MTAMNHRPMTIPISNPNVQAETDFRRVTTNSIYDG